MKYLIILALAFTFIFPDITLAQTPLVPCDGSPTDPCNICHFVDLSNNIIVWLIGVLMVVFAVMAVVAGFGLVTSGGNPSAKEAAKSKFTNAVIGLVVVLAGWLIVDTVMRTLLSGGEGEFQMTGFGPWAQIECVAQPTVSQAPPPAAPTTPVPPGAPSPTTPGISAGNAAAVRSQLSNAGIAVNNQECPSNLTYEQYRTQTGSRCTSVAGLNQQTINELIIMRQQCGATCDNLTITGGTEAGHANCRTPGEASCSRPGSHSAGDKIDLGKSSNPGISNYINNDTYFQNGMQGAREGRVNRQTGAACVDEGTHWDCQRAM